MNGFSRILCSIVLLAAGALSCTKEPSPVSYNQPRIDATSSEISENQVILSCDVSGQNISECGFLFGESEYELNQYSSDNLSQGKFSTKIDGLSFNVDYWYSAYIGGGKNSITSEKKHFRIQQQLAGLEIKPVSERTSNSAVCEYTVTNNFSGSLYACGLCWSEEPEPTIESTTKTIDGASYGVHTTTISGLELGKTYYVRAYAINAQGTVYSNEETFYTPITFADELFGCYMLGFADKDEDGFISLEEASKVTKIYLQHLSNYISSMEGIEYFTSLESLEIYAEEDCNGYLAVCLSEVDLEKNVNLKKIHLENAQLKSIKLPKEANIEELDLSYNKLEGSLDLSSYPNLEYLDLSGGNKITELKLCNNAQFKYLDISSNPISSLNLITQQNIQYLGISGTGLSDLNTLFKKVSGLTRLNVGSNLKEGDKVYLMPKLEYLDCTGAQTFSLNVSYNSKLQTLIINSSRILSIDLSMNRVLEYFDARGCTGLSKIYLLEGQYVSGIDNSRNGYGIPSFTEKIYSSRIEDSAFNEYLLDCFDANNDGYVSVLEATDVKEIVIDNTKYSNITSLHGIEMFTSLEKLNFAGQRVSSIDLSANTALTELVCDGNPLESIDLRYSKQLKKLYCQSTTLTELNLTSNEELEEAYLFNSRLSDITCVFAYNLKTLDISCNNLSGTIYLSQNPFLQSLKCTGNTLLDQVVINQDCEGSIQIEKDDHTEITYREWQKM